MKIQDLFDDEQKKSYVSNYFETKDNSIGQNDFQQGIIINITDSEAAKIISSQLEELVKNLKK